MKKIIFSDVTARDGLQSLNKLLSLNQKTKLIQDLSKCKFLEIEVGSLINPKIIPQMKDSIDVYNNTISDNYKSFLLAGNKKSIDDINNKKIKYFSLFSSTSDAFNLSNINTTILGSFLRFRQMMEQLDNRNYHHIKGYISCIGECPYKGDIPIEKTLRVIEDFIDIGINEICLADTIGTLEPDKLDILLKETNKIYDPNLLSLHFHTDNKYSNETWKRNLDVSLKNGIFKFDTSLLGIGGCPTAYSQCTKNGNLDIKNAVMFFKENNIEIENIDTNKLLSEIIKLEKKWKNILI